MGRIDRLLRRTRAGRPRVVILGGGFAGLGAAIQLRADRHDVTLVDRRASFEFLPNIHELLSGVKTPELLRLPLEPCLRKAGHRFVRETVTGLDRATGRVLTSEGELPYDVLVVALGGVDATRGVPGVVEHALSFKSVDDCQRIGRRLAALAEREEPANVVIVGGGLEGIEALGEILRRYRDRPIHVTLVEAQDRLLPEAPASLDESVRDLCASHRVELRVGSPAQRIESGTVVVGDQALPSDLTIWTGGPTAPALLAEWGLAAPGAWAPVRPTLESTEHAGIFVAGDACALPTPLSKQAYHALGMGVHVARNVERLRAGRDLTPFRSSGKPTLVSFGDLATFMVAGDRVVGAPALAAAKEAVFELVMAQLDPRPAWRVLPQLAGRSQRAAQELLWPSMSSVEAILRQGQLSVR